MNNEHNRLTNKVGVITGASSGIGRAIAIALASIEVKLCLISRQVNQLENFIKDNNYNPSDFLLIEKDLTKIDATKEIRQQIMKRFGQADILVHSAGSLEYGDILDLNSDLLDFHLDINLRTPYALTRELLPSLIDQKGQIVFINSSIIDFPKARASHYAASKQALKGLADSLRQEVNESGVRVLSVYPGRTATPLQEKLYKSENKAYLPEKMLQPEDIASIVVSSLSLPYTAEVTDIKIRPMMK